MTTDEVAPGSETGELRSAMAPADVATTLEGLNDRDLNRMRRLMDPDLVAWVTGPSEATNR